MPTSERYTHAEEYVREVQALWDARSSADSSSLLSPVSAQGQPVHFQAGDSAEGRDFAARRAEGIFTHRIEFDDAVAFTADIRRRARSYGRPGDDIVVFPAANIVVAETDAEAREKAEHHRAFALNDRRIRQVVEAVWGRDLSDLDVDGPLPERGPELLEQTKTNGVVNTSDDPQRKAAEWRELAAARGYSVRQLVTHLQRTFEFVGSASSVADQLAHYVRSDALDGLNVTPHAFPDGLDDVVRLLVPELQERGVYRTEYEGTTLRENLGLPESVGRRVLAGAR
ncbi:LLM class flavin-dependent oxidoreductase [Agromyces atrinae]|nr:LLM class flavin-dependent oxidoreductase [Agromyces atrinae]